MNIFGACTYVTPSSFSFANQSSIPLPKLAPRTSYLFQSTLKSVFLGGQQLQARALSFASTPSLTSLLKTGRSHYLFLQRATNEQKIERIIQQALNNSLAFFGQRDTGTTTEETWNQLQNILKNYSVALPPFKEQMSEESIQILFRLFSRKLIREASVDTDFQASQYITNPTEFYWSYHLPTFPFTRVQKQPNFDLSRISYILKQTDMHITLSDPIEKEIRDWIYYSSTEDALSAFLLATPYLDSDTFVHEIGCWNGENLFNLLYHSHLQKKTIAGCVGTDINIRALNIAEITGNIIGLGEPLVQFHLANALHPLNLTSLGISYKREVRVALRLLPVLEPQNAKHFLLTLKKSFKGEKAILILSYALLKGHMYELNKQRAASFSQPSVKEEQFTGGSVFKTLFPLPGALPSYLQRGIKYNLIINTYYTEDGFNNLVKESGFHLVQTVIIGESSDNYRAIAVLLPS